MAKFPWLVLMLAVASPAPFAQKKPATAPGNETKSPSAIRSPHSMGGDLQVPLCPAQFHDSMQSNGIAGAHEPGVTDAKITTAVPALLTQQAIAASDKTHIGNYVVLIDTVVNATGQPTQVCLRKSSGYGLDAAAAAAVAKYKFQPAQKDGKPVKMRVEVNVRFANPIVG